MAKPSKKIMAILVAAVIIIAGSAGYYFVAGRNNAAGESSVPAAKTGKGAFPATVKDARVYSAIEKYLKAQVENNRDTVLARLSPEHRLEWDDGSYLLTEQALAQFSEVRLADVKMGVIEFAEDEGQEYAGVLVSFNLYLIKDGQLSSLVSLVEDLVLVPAGDDWLIAQSLRDVVTPGS